MAGLNWSWVLNSYGWGVERKLRGVQAVQRRLAWLLLWLRWLVVPSTNAWGRNFRLLHLLSLQLTWAKTLVQPFKYLLFFSDNLFFSFFQIIRWRLLCPLPEWHPPSLVLFLCRCVCRLVYRHTCFCGGQRLTLVLFLRSCPLCFTGPLVRTWNLLITWFGLVSRPQWSFCLHLPVLGLQGQSTHLAFFAWILWVKLGFSCICRKCFTARAVSQLLVLAFREFFTYHSIRVFLGIAKRQQTGDCADG